MLSIEWDEHPDAEEYYVYREDSPIVDIPESPYFIVSWNSFFEHINEEGTYYYRVVAVKDEGTSYSDISNEISFTFEFLDENDNNVSEDEGDTDESEGQDQDGDEDNTDTGQNNNTNTGDSDKSGDPDNDGDSGIPGYPIGAFV